jgi:hypothetical protein
MNNKTQKLRDELEKIEIKMTALKERGKTLEQKIREAETLEICALMRSENLSMDELVALARSRKENQGLPQFTDRPEKMPEEEADGQESMGNETTATAKQKEYWEEDEDDEDDE